MSRFRAVLFDRQRTKWRASREEAVQDAIARGWASRDDYPGSRVFYSVGVQIEEDPQKQKGGTPKRPPFRVSKIFPVE